ncbi:MAG: hypothetical protein P1U58_09790 [Verrucomicrobiales bacterium]|nr:hypothetical protein [Verrucomicrobiales bacterium]
MSVVFIPVPEGKKGPQIKGYPDFTIEKMSEPAYLSQLEEGNIAVLVGANSVDLVSIDLDEEEAYAEFERMNPDICKTTKSYGKRGLNLWFNMRGDYPDSVIKLLDENGSDVGEWRGGGGITVVDGKHPSGCQYRVDSTFPVKRISFYEIKWPESWEKYPGRVDPFDVLVARCGPPYQKGSNGGVTLNESFIARWIETENDIRFEGAFHSFFQYSEKEGIWKRLATQQVDALILSYIARLAAESNDEGLHLKTRKTSISSIRSLLEALTYSTDLATGISPDGWHCFAALNCVIGVVEPSVKEGGMLCPLPFSPGFLLLGKSEVPFEIGAKCPRLLNELLCPVLDLDDVALLQKMFGLILVSRNSLQKILLLEGEGGLGKGIAAQILNSVLGRAQVTELRTRSLHSRFEVSRYRGKRLLAGRDVSSDFLKTPGASMLKALTGGDLLSTELKNANEVGDLVGDFHVVITSNSPLHLRHDEDSSAWKRRIVIVRFHTPSEGLPKRIRHFDQVLLKEEGPGILNWMLQGAQIALQEIHEDGTLSLTTAQRARISNRVRESDTVGFFVESRLVYAAGRSLSSEQLLLEYQRFCFEKEITCEGDCVFHRRVKARIEEHFGGQVTPSENIRLAPERKKLRGYRGVALASR